MKKLFNWHFWIPEWNVQIVIDKSSYQGAVSHLEIILREYRVGKSPKYKFQFGQQAIK